MCVSISPCGVDIRGIVGPLGMQGSTIFFHSIILRALLRRLCYIRIRSDLNIAADCVNVDECLDIITWQA